MSAPTLQDGLHAMVDGWYAAPTNEPLVLERSAGGGVIFSRGIQSVRMTKVECAAFLGCSRSKVYDLIKRRKLHVGTDGKVARVAAQRLLNQFDGRD